MIKMRLPAGSSSVSFSGVEYKGKKGIVEVPEEAEQTFYSFGLLTVGKNVPEDEPASEPEPVVVEPVVPTEPEAPTE